MPMRNPKRPGRMVRNIIDELDITVTEAAKRLGVARQTLNNLINNEKAAVSPEMAVRLATVFGSLADNWLRMQANHDAAQIRLKQADIVKGLKRIKPKAA